MNFEKKVSVLVFTFANMLAHARCRRQFSFQFLRQLGAVADLRGAALSHGPSSTHTEGHD